MIKCEWIEFMYENDPLTEKEFEEMMGETFQAMMVDENNFPQFIWTANHVVIVTKRVRHVEDVEFKKIPRNPGCE
ncbi:hypothetical protein [Gottfriedia acidiceleris]|uniref:Uncharacterized protein n=1 Tax=Gottfriedia acidiceleris TaxID=371036 RepID=A0ABY4JGM5_9BACI|nr:hypothetical protein [Gottfriedia acidiceleris]UPM52963.1 hypothetical protein MY490_14150 [Gottfriedia acidiceleris]